MAHRLQASRLWRALSLALARSALAPLFAAMQKHDPQP